MFPHLDAANAAAVRADTAAGGRLGSSGASLLSGPEAAGEIVSNGVVTAYATAEEDDRVGMDTQDASEVPATVEGALGAEIGAQEAQVRARAQGQTHVSFAGVEMFPAEELAAQEDGEERLALVDPRHAMGEIKALAGELGYGDKREVIAYLADPTVRPVDPSLPTLTAEQEARLSNASQSVRDWDADLILMLTPFAAAAGQHLRQRMVKEGRMPTEVWAPPPNRDTVRRIVPPMGRETRQQRDGQRQPPAALPTTPSQGLSGSAFSVGGGADPDGGGGSKMRRERPGYDSDELTKKRQRLDEQGRGTSVGRPPVPGFASSSSAAPETPRTPRHPGAALALTTVGTPARTPRLGGDGGLTGGASRDRRRSSGSVLRYRSRDFTPRRRPRPSLLATQGHSPGTLGEWLGETGGRGGGGNSNGGAVSGIVGREERGAGARRRANGQVLEAVESMQEDVGGASKGRKRRGSSSFGLAERILTRARRGTAEEEAAASRVTAAVDATAEVGSILMEVVGQQDKSLTSNAQDEKAQARKEVRGKEVQLKRGGAAETTDARCVYLQGVGLSDLLRWLRRTRRRFRDGWSCCLFMWSLGPLLTRWGVGR